MLSVGRVSLRFIGGTVEAEGLGSLGFSAVGISGVVGGVIAVGERGSVAIGEARWGGSAGISVMVAGSSQDSGSALGRLGSCSGESWRCGSRLVFMRSKRASPMEEVEGGGAGGGGGEGGLDGSK